MAHGELCYDLMADGVDDPVVAWSYVVCAIRKHGKPPADMFEQVVYAYRSLYRTRIVVNGAIVADVARRFKQAGFPLDSLRSNQGVLQVSVLAEGVHYVLYEDTDGLAVHVRDFITHHTPTPWRARLAQWCLRHR